MPARVYAMYSSTCWVDPINPGPNIICPALAGKNKCCQVECQHLEGRKKFHQMTIIKTGLKNLLYAATKPKYWAGMRDTILGLTCFCILVIFSWIFCMYGCIYPQEVANNKLKIMQLWDPYIPFAMLVERFCECQHFATNSNNPNGTTSTLLTKCSPTSSLTSLMQEHPDANSWACRVPTYNTSTSRQMNSPPRLSPVLLLPKQRMQKIPPCGGRTLIFNQNFVSMKDTSMRSPCSCTTYNCKWQHRHSQWTPRPWEPMDTTIHDATKEAAMEVSMEEQQQSMQHQQTSTILLHSTKCFSPAILWR